MSVASTVPAIACWARPTATRSDVKEFMATENYGVGNLFGVKDVPYSSRENNKTDNIGKERRGGRVTWRLFVTSSTRVVLVQWWLIPPTGLGHADLLIYPRRHPTRLTAKRVARQSRSAKSYAKMGLSLAAVPPWSMRADRLSDDLIS